MESKIKYQIVLRFCPQCKRMTDHLLIHPMKITECKSCGHTAKHKGGEPKP